MSLWILFLFSCSTSFYNEPFFKYHDYIPVRYNKEKKIYYISMNRRDEKTRSYMEPLPGCEFTLTEEEFDERFDEIMDFLISKVEMIK